MKKKNRNILIIVAGCLVISLIALWIFGYKISITSRQEVGIIDGKIEKLKNSIKLDSSKNKLINYELLNNDTINVQLLQKSETKNWYESSLFSWLVPLIIGIAAAFIPLLIVYLQYRSSLYSKNRQDWIDRVRDRLGEYLTQSKLLNIKLHEEEQDAQGEFILHEKLNLSRNMLLLLLNPKISKHESVIDSMVTLENLLDHHMNTREFDNLQFYRNAEAVLTLGRELLYSEWQEIQKGKWL